MKLVQWMMMGGVVVSGACAEPDEIEPMDLVEAEQATTSLDSPNGFSMQAWAGAWGTDGPNYTGDLNGDGKTDVFMWRDSNKDWTVNLSSGAGFTMNVWTGAWGSDGPTFVADLNGDRRTDVFMWRDSDKSWMVNLSTGSGFNMQRWVGGWGSDGPVRVGDFNGDGRADVMMWRASDASWTVNLSTGSGFTQQRWYGFGGMPTHVGDLDGNGKSDIFMWSEAEKLWLVNLSTGSGFVTRRWAGAWGSDGPINVGDLNGDGRTDVFMYRAGDWTVNLSTGSGFSQQRWLGACGSDGPMELGDFNGDGRTDVLVWRDANKDWLVNFSVGNGWSVQRWEGMWGSDGPRRLVADLNGDRRSDVLMWRDPTRRWSVNISQPVTLGPRRTADYGISAVEVSQAVQDLRNNTPLFAGKKTLVRVYADAGACSSGAALPNLTVAAKLVRASAPTVPVWGPVVLAPESVPRRVNRDELGDTINFELPSSLPTTESYILKVTANPCIDLADNEATCARRLPGLGQTFDTPLRFYASVPLHIRPIYDDINGTLVSSADFAKVAERVGQMYPVADVIVHDFRDIARGITWAQLGSFKSLAMLLDNVEVQSGLPPKWCGDCFFVGVPWVPPTAVPYGVASSTPAMTTEYRLAISAVDPTDINWSAGTLAQEIGHLLGRFHATGHGEAYPDASYPYPSGAQSDDTTYTLLPNVVSRGKSYGLDPGPSSSPAWRVIPSYTADNQHHHDFMSYGAWVDIWTSDYTFKGICGANRSGYFDTKWKRVSELPAGALPPTSKCTPMAPFVLP